MLKRWEAAEVEALRRLAAEGVIAKDIAFQLGRPIEGVQTKARLLGIDLVRASFRTSAKRRVSMIFSG